MSDINIYRGTPDTLKVHCANCQWEGRTDECDEIEDLSMRIDAGETVPAGQCPHCGCLAHLIEPVSDDLPDSEAMIEIQQILSGNEWTPDTVDAIAQVMRRAGYTIDGIDEEPDRPDAQSEVI